MTHVNIPHRRPSRPLHNSVTVISSPDTPRKTPPPPQTAPPGDALTLSARTAKPHRPLTHGDRAPMSHYRHNNFIFRPYSAHSRKYPDGSETTHDMGGVILMRGGIRARLAQPRGASLHPQARFAHPGGVSHPDTPVPPLPVPPSERPRPLRVAAYPRTTRGPLPSRFRFCARSAATFIARALGAAPSCCLVSLPKERELS